MLFNSPIFVFLFLPITLLGFHLICQKDRHEMAVGWLVGASLFFYGWWNPMYLGLMLLSILFNYSVGIMLSKRSHQSTLIGGVIVNLGILGYFKYANFFVDTINTVTGSSVILNTIILPLAISFFTFQQITYLVDAYRGETKSYTFLHYCVFVTFFPQLIAGPIVHHKEMLPQFMKGKLQKLKSEHLAVGVTIFMMGLFKKVIIADGIAVHATPVFEAAQLGSSLTFLEAWGGALAYSFQLYFDFSGYSDMAIGLARMFGITLPVNFFSPYKASSIIDFWNRWHITLSKFLRDYLYIPLGGNRKGIPRRYANLMITMLLGGLWHGAGWTFVIWGGLHGFYLVINHGWRLLKKQIRIPMVGSVLGLFAGRILTFLSVVFSWVVFRAESWDGSLQMYKGMLGMNGFSFPALFENKLSILHTWFPDTLIVANGLGQFGDNFALIKIFLLLILVWYMPNTLEWMQRQKPALGLEGYPIKPLKNIWMQWQPNIVWAFIVTVISVLSVLSLSKVSEFLYFQF